MRAIRTPLDMPAQAETPLTAAEYGVARVVVATRAVVLVASATLVIVGPAWLRTHTPQVIFVMAVSLLYAADDDQSELNAGSSVTWKTGQEALVSSEIVG